MEESYRGSDLNNICVNDGQRCWGGGQVVSIIVQMIVKIKVSMMMSLAIMPACHLPGEGGVPTKVAH